MTRLALAMLVVASAVGCRSLYGLADPDTTLKVHPLTKSFTYRSGANNSAKMENVELDAEKKLVRIGSLEFTSDKAVVRDANANQMDRVNALHETMGQSTDRILGRFDDLSRGLLPGGVRALGSKPTHPAWYIAGIALFALIMRWRPAR